MLQSTPLCLFPSHTAAFLSVMKGGLSWWLGVQALDSDSLDLKPSPSLVSCASLNKSPDLSLSSGLITPYKTRMVIVLISQGCCED